jgi:hypothetical protein
MTRTSFMSQYVTEPMNGCLYRLQVGGLLKEASLQLTLVLMEA